MFILHALLFGLFLFLFVSGSAAAHDCGTALTFHLTFKNNSKLTKIAVTCIY